MPPLKILYVITKANWGGAQKYVFDLASEAKRRGMDVSVAYGKGTEGGLSDALEKAGIRTLTIEGLQRDIKGTKEVGAFKGLVTLFHTEKPDIVHLNSSKVGAFGALAARVVGVPQIIFTAHGWAFNEDRPWWQKIVFFKVHAFTIMLSHKTICVSEATRHDMRFVPFIKNKMVVIRNGVTEPVLKTHSEARQALWAEKENSFWIGMLSELHPTKRVIDAIKAVELVHAKHPNVVLVVLGEGSERAALEKYIAEKQLQKFVRLAGFVPQGSSYLSAFDVFLHSSRTESLAYAVVEAGAAGLPVVATRVGGLPEIIDDQKTGLLVPPLQPAALADALNFMLDDPGKAKEFGNALQQQIQQRFSRTHMLEKTFALY